MTIPEAITNLAVHANGYKKEPDPSLIPSMWLGIEALKAWRQAKMEGKLSPDELLPGETKE